MSTTMSNESTSNTSHCDQCAVALTDENRGYATWRDRCDRCHGRSELTGHLLDVAYMANQYYRPSDTVSELQHDIAELRVRVQELRKPVGADDPRVAHLWEKLWDALDGDIERDQTWGLFMDTIPGLPDYRVKTYGGVVTLKFYFSEVEISGSDKWDIERAILDAIEGDLRFGYEDEWEVDYEEE